MSLFSKLFGRSGTAPDATAEAAASETHGGFTITPAPEKAAGGWRIGARIEREVDGTWKTHTLIRADVISDRAQAEAASVAKARQVIDEQGDRLFDA